MAKTLRTSGDYTIKTGTGFTGDNSVILDSKFTRVKGDLIVDGTEVTVNTTNLTVEDQFIEVNRNNSTAGIEDSGIVFNQGTADHAVFYYDASSNEFRVGTTTTVNIADGSTIKTEIQEGAFTLANIKVATTPTDANHAASKNYVDTVAGGAASFELNITGDDSTVISVGSGSVVDIAGGSNISTVATEPDTITISLDRDLNGIDTISTDRSNQDLTLTANGTGEVVIDPVLTFTLGTANPTATTSTKVYNKTAGGGGTGLYFKNTNIDSGTEGELISKKKATALAIALG